MTDSQGYSTLEVSSRHYQNGDQGLEVHDSHGPGPWNSEDKYLQPTTVPYHPLKEYSHELPTSPQQHPDDDAGPMAQQKRRICGFSRRVFIAGIVIAALVVIGAIAGGVAGGLLSRQGSASNDADRSILAISNIAAANRTVKGSEQRTIFFQDGTGALIARHILAPSTQWETTNLTGRFESSSTKIRIARGAPMAAVSCADWGCGDTRLFYMRTDGMLGNAKDDGDLGGALWHPPIGNVLDAKLRPSPGAQLAATLTKHYKEEDGGPENIGLNRLLAYQGLDGFIYVANDSAYDRPVRLETEIVDPTDNTSLAMITQLRENMLDQVSLVTNGTGQTSASRSDVALREAKFPNDDDEWYEGSETLDTISQASTETPSLATTAQLAVTMRNNWRDSVYLVLLSDGTITGRITGDTEVTIERFRLAGSEDELPRFTAIATTMNGYLYGIVDDTIREYTFDTSDPSLLHFEAIIYDESIRERDSAGEDG